MQYGAGARRSLLGRVRLRESRCRRYVRARHVDNRDVAQAAFSVGVFMTTAMAIAGTALLALAVGLVILQGVLWMLGGLD